MSDAAYVRWFRELDEQAGPLVGGKNAGLGEMIQAGLRVPTGFALTTHAHADFLDGSGVRAALHDALAGVDPDDTTRLDAASAAARRLIEATPFSDRVARAIAEAYTALADECGIREPAVAVRSSAVGEDSAAASFAGQQETYLWVRGAEAVVEHARRCWSSLYTPQAVAYRARLGMAPDVACMSVGVQRMVDAEVAGVMFTLNPLNGDRSKIVIEASWGLGVSVVGGEVTPDEYWVDKVTLDVLRRTVSPKGVQYSQAPDAAGIVCEEVPAERQLCLCLADAHVTELARLGKLVEQIHGAPRDIEWAIDRRLPFPENVLLLQSRPETVWSQRAAAPLRRPHANPLDYVMDYLLTGPQPLKRGT